MEACSAQRTASIRGALQDLATELRALQQARQRTAESLMALCEAAARKPVGGAEGSSEPSEEKAEEAGGRGGAAAPVAEETVAAPARQADTAATIDDGAPAALQPGALAEEVLSRIRGAMERTHRDPRAVFARFCGGQDVLRQEDLGRVLEAFEPGGSEALQALLWRRMGKADGDTASFSDFCQLCGLRLPQTVEATGGRAGAAAPGTVSRFPIAGGGMAARAARTAAGGGGMAKPAPLSHSAAVPGPLSAQPAAPAPLSSQPAKPAKTAPLSQLPASRTASSPDERRARVLLYRFGRALNILTGATREELSRPREAGMQMQEFLQVVDRHDIPVSRPEAVTLFFRFSIGPDRILHPDFFHDALRAAGSQAPPEVVEARRVLVAAAAASGRSSRDSPVLWGELLALGDKEGASNLPAVRELLARHTAIDDECWESIKVSLDKRSDGAVLLAPLLEFVARTGGDESGAPAEPPPTLRPQGKRKDLLSNSWIPRRNLAEPLASVSEEAEEEEDGGDDHARS